MSAQEWTPRPDPAPFGRPGMRPHVHPPNTLYGWVFCQHQVWVDYWGNQHEIDSMPIDYVGAVIGFCQERAYRIQALVALELLHGALTARAAGEAAERCASGYAGSVSNPDVLLEHTPLMRALHRRLTSTTPDEKKST